MKNSADLEEFYGPSVSMDNTLRDFSDPTKAELNNCFIIYSKYFPTLKACLVPRQNLHSLYCSPLNFPPCANSNII